MNCLSKIQSSLRPSTYCSFFRASHCPSKQGLNVLILSNSRSTLTFESGNLALQI